MFDLEDSESRAPLQELRQIIDNYKPRRGSMHKKLDLRRFQHNLLNFLGNKNNLKEEYRKLIAIIIFLPDFFGEYEKVNFEIIANPQETRYRTNMYYNPFALALSFLLKHMQQPEGNDHKLQFELKNLSQRAYLQLLIIKTIFRDLSITVEDLVKGETVPVYSSNPTTKHQGAVQNKAACESIFNWRNIITAPYNLCEWLKSKLYSAYWFIKTLGPRYYLRKLKQLFAEKTTIDNLISKTSLAFIKKAPQLAETILLKNSSQFHAEANEADISFFKGLKARLKSAEIGIKALNNN